MDLDLDGSTFGLPTGTNTYMAVAEDDSLAFSNTVTTTGAANPASTQPQITYVTPTTLPGLPLPQTQLLTINGSGFTSTSMLQFFDGTNYYNNRVPTFVSPNQLTYNIKVGDVTANWTVTVINADGWESNPAAFSVQSDGDTTAPAPARRADGDFARPDQEFIQRDLD